MELPKRRIGGTDISKLCGVNPYGDAFDVWERIVLSKQQPLNPRMIRGQREEPRIRAMFVEQTGAELVSPKPDVVQHPEHEFATVSPDDWAVWDGFAVSVDYKSVSVFAAKSYGPDGSDQVPDHYALQLHWAMCVADKPIAALFCAFGKDVKNEKDEDAFAIEETRLYWLERDHELDRNLLRIAGDFWERYVLTGTPPPREPKKKPTKQTREAAAHEQ